ncbi:MAG TPA: hypothetical protein PJ991_07675 [Kiritimatiellia bacterium]|nr:hypothetical protein [Kiritimatiellia bacterium]
MITNPEKILHVLDQRLNGSVELTLFGRTALALGFPDQTAYARTVYVDVILAEGEAEDYLERTNFWDVIEQINAEFASEGLYMSHFFVEDQIILRPGWRAFRVRLPGIYQRIDLFRPANEDIFLTKLMRYDPIDIEDAQMIWNKSGWTRNQVETLIGQAKVPDIAEIREQFALCVREILGDAGKV